MWPRCPRRPRNCRTSRRSLQKSLQLSPSGYNYCPPALYPYCHCPRTSCRKRRQVRRSASHGVSSYRRCSCRQRRCSLPFCPSRLWLSGPRRLVRHRRFSSELSPYRLPCCCRVSPLYSCRHASLRRSGGLPPHCHPRFLLPPFPPKVDLVWNWLLPFRRPCCHPQSPPAPRSHPSAPCSGSCSGSPAASPMLSSPCPCHPPSSTFQICW
mmetsp:Transcript_1324/g.2948  ORF Transcript_1324/g.2948 Transcript_1324/m.2948 type:complete len:210 (-) Transcript_1324:2020-2649(-)